VCVRGRGGRRAGGGHDVKNVHRSHILSSSHIACVRLSKNVAGRGLEEARSTEPSLQPHSVTHAHEARRRKENGRRTGGGREAQNFRRSHILSPTHIRCVCMCVCQRTRRWVENGRRARSTSKHINCVCVC